ncbi:efflux RND transporter periplasmic adaptor subunit [Chryseotalea sanaruensis]|uniref:Efflux RND transporter periplasmic adaptor subunit n=1 Tax=Chryseotalea sanaruensis TaxID=2482724 RepID=A0A401UCX1_9BACT|nr:efflux RND transporter periplasmic adaptor subunit [Chryseotalea sanaruensis]GCC52748.1 efflux RND transporter periplasmic adaptor subunit [Chryseotalea sanaruensis]
MKTIIFIVLLSTIILSGCIHKEHIQHEEAIFKITKVIQRDTTLNQTYVCQIRSIQHIEMRALEKGYLQKVFVDEGKKVKKGQLLFQILPIVYQAEAQRAKAEVSFAEIEYQNTKALADSNVVSKNELALAKATLDKEKADYQLAKAHLSFTEIRAPFDGIVGRFNDVRVGSLLDEGELLTTLSDNKKMWVYFNVPESEYIDYMNNRNTEVAARVTLQMANNEMFKQEGVIETIEADFNNETGNIAFRAAFENPTGILRHGETGNIFMHKPLKGAILIPQAATFEVLDKKFVYAVDSNDVVHAQEITIRNEMPHIYEVTEGLNPGDKILIEGIRKVKNGDKIHYTEKAFDSILRELTSLKAE